MYTVSFCGRKRCAWDGGDRVHAREGSGGEMRRRRRLSSCLKLLQLAEAFSTTSESPRAFGSFYVCLRAEVRP